MEVIEMLERKYDIDTRIGICNMIIGYACIRDLFLLDFDILSDEEKIKLIDGMDNQFSGFCDAFLGLSLCYFTNRKKFNNYWRLVKLIYEVEMLKIERDS